MKNVQALLSSQDEATRFNVAQLWTDVLVGENQYADLALFCALEEENFIKAKQIYKSIFRGVFQDFIDNNDYEAA